MHFGTRLHTKTKLAYPKTFGSTQKAPGGSSLIENLSGRGGPRKLVGLSLLSMALKQTNQDSYLFEVLFFQCENVVRVLKSFATAASAHCVQRDVLKIP